MTPMITRDAPRLICGSRPNSRTRATMRSICSSVALRLGDDDHGAIERERSCLREADELQAESRWLAFAA